MYSIDTKKYANKCIKACNKKGLKIDLENPKTLQDKLVWLNIYDTNPLKVECADKVKIHDYSKRILGKDICIPLLRTYDNASDIKWEELPNKFVIKCNHGSGMNIIVKDKEALDKKKYHIEIKQMDGN